MTVIMILMRTCFLIRDDGEEDEGKPDGGIEPEYLGHAVDV